MKNVLQIGFLIACISPIFCNTLQAKTVIKLDPKQTYFPTGPGDAELRIGHTVNTGDWLAIQTSGAFKAGDDFDDVTMGATAIFTRNCCLIDNLNVFVGAPTNSDDVPSFEGGLFNYAEDFPIPIGPNYVVVQVPNIRTIDSNGRSGSDSTTVDLQFSAVDSFFADNTDPNNDYFITIFGESDLVPIQFNEFVTPCVNNFPVTGCNLIFGDDVASLGDLNVGDNSGEGLGHGVVTISSDSELNANNAAVGFSSSGEVIVNHSKLNVAQNTVVGGESFGRLTLQNFASANLNQLSIGLQGNGVVSLKLASELNIEHALTIGAGGTGGLSFTGNSRAKVRGTTTIGLNASGSVTLQNTSVLEAFGFLLVGDGDAGLLRIHSGSNVIAPNGSNIGSERGGSGNVLVGGVGSLFRVGGAASGDLGIGSGGLGQVSVSDGGILRIIGASTGSVPNQPRLLVGHNGGDGTLIVGPGGTVTVEDITRSGSDDGIHIGGSSTAIPSTGLVDVFGIGASLKVIGNNGFINVGTSGIGTFNVANSAQVEIFGTEFFSILNVGRGEDATGNMSITNDAVVRVKTETDSNAGSFLVLGVGDDSTSLLDISSGGQLLLEPGIALNGGAQIGAAPGSEATLTIDGNNSILDSANTVFVGKVAEFGFETFGTGAVTVSNGAILRAANVLVGVDGTLQGNGTVDGAIENRGGTVSPGLSPGTLTVLGDYTQTDGNLILEVGGLSDGLFDVLEATGNIDLLGGTVIIKLIDGFLFEANDEILLFNSLGTTTLGRTNFLLDGVSDDFQFQLNTVSNGLSLFAINSASPVPAPAAIWLFGSCMVALAGFTRRKFSGQMSILS